MTARLRRRAAPCLILLTLLSSCSAAHGVPATVANAASPHLDNGLMDWWQADGDAVDSAGPYNGTLSNTGFTSGEIGQAFSFNGSNSSVDFGPNAGNFGTSDFTIQFWIKITSPSPQGIMAKRPVCDHANFWDIHGSSGGLTLEMDQNGTNYFSVSTTKAIGDGAFHLITFARSGTTVSVYTDGTFDSSNSAPGVTDMDNSTNLVAGRSPCSDYWPTKWFNGALDDIRLYNRALSADEIAAYYASAPPAAPPANPGLMDWWQADGNAVDSAGPANGTLSNTGFTDGVSGQAFSFNGSNSSVDFGPNAGSFSTSDFTIQFWIKTTSPRVQGILGKRPVCDHGYFWDIRGSSGGLSLEMDQNGTNYFSVGTTTAIGDGAFHLVTFVRRGTIVSAYTDGTFNSSNSAPGVTDMDNSSDLIAGRSTCTGSDSTTWFTGSLDDIRLYNRALSNSEIADYYAAAVPTATALPPATPTPPPAPSTDTPASSDTPTTTPSPSAIPTQVTSLHVMAGGGTYTDSQGTQWTSDAPYVSGASDNFDGSTISGTADPRLYQGYRFGTDFTYHFSIAPGTYVVRLRYMEPYWTSSGQRISNVDINGQRMGSNIDIFSEVGKHAALDKVFPATVGSDGALTIHITTDNDYAVISSVEVTPAPTTFTPYRVMAGGPQDATYTDTAGNAWESDTPYVTGASNNFDGSTITGTGDPRLYQGYRFGDDFNYWFAVPSGDYTVHLRYMEPYWTSAGHRISNVDINGQRVASNIDVFAQVGQHAAFDEVFRTHIDDSGRLNVHITTDSDHAVVSSIDVEPAPPPPTDTPTGTPTPLPNRDACLSIPAGSADAVGGDTVLSPSGLGHFDGINGSWALYKTVDFSRCGDTFVGHVAHPDNGVDGSPTGQHIELHLDSVSGPLIGSLAVQSTGGWGIYQDQTASVSKPNGSHDFYLVANGGWGVANIASFSFSEPSTPTPTPTSTPVDPGVTDTSTPSTTPIPAPFTPTDTPTATETPIPPPPSDCGYFVNCDLIGPSGQNAPPGWDAGSGGGTGILSCCNPTGILYVWNHSGIQQNVTFGADWRQGDTAILTFDLTGDDSYSLNCNNNPDNYPIFGWYGYDRENWHLDQGESGWHHETITIPNVGQAGVIMFVSGASCHFGMQHPKIILQHADGTISDPDAPTATPAAVTSTATPAATNIPTATPSPTSIATPNLVSTGSGVVSWHPHYAIHLSDRLSASVDLSDGHVDVTAADLSIPAQGPDLALAHTWDSVLGQASIPSMVGTGWQSSLSPGISGSLAGTLVFTDATGATWPFTYTGSFDGVGSYQTPPGLPWQLLASSAGYSLTNILSGQTLSFDAQGRLRADADAYGNTNTFSYGASGPTSETNSGTGTPGSGRALAFSYDPASGLLTDARNPSSQQHVGYGYDGAGNLTTLTWGQGSPAAATARFGYTSTLNGTQLLTVTTPGGHAWTIGYDTAGRVSSLTSPADPTTSTPSYTTVFTYTPGQTQMVEGAGSTSPVTTTYTLDAQGEATGITDALGHTSGATYDADHDLTSSTDALGRTTTYTYTYVGPSTGAGIASTGLLTQSVQPAPNLPSDATPVVTRYHYNATNDLDEVDRPNGGTTYYTYDGSHHQVTSTAEQLGATTWRGTLTTYDALGNLSSSVDGRGVSVSADGRTVTPNGLAAAYTRRYTYTAQGDLQSASTPPITTTLGANTPATTTYGYDAEGNLSTMTTPNGNTTTYAYDALGRLVQTTQPRVTLWDGSTAAPTESIGYDGDGNVISSTDGAGDTTTDTYDPLGRLVSTVNPVGATTLYTYSATTLSAVQDPAGHVTTYGYDAAGQRTSATDPLGVQTQYGYDAVGNTTAITTPLAGFGASTVETRTYDALNAVVTDTVGGTGEPSPTQPQTTTAAYDAEGNLLTTTAPNGDLTTHTYDLADRPLGLSLRFAQLGPAVATQSLSLDPADNLIAQTDFTLRTHTLAYDGATHLVQQVDTCPACADNLPITTTITDDPDGNPRSLIQQQDQVPVQSAFTYNAADWLLSQDDGLGPTYFGYDAAGRLMAQSLAGGAGALIATRDAAGRITALRETVPATTTTSTSRFTYLPNSLPLTDTLPNGVVAGRQYDADNRLSALTDQLAGGAITLAYGYDPQGWLAAITTTAGGAPVPEHLTHDARGRLVADTQADGSQTVVVADGNDNITTLYAGYPSGPGLLPPLSALYAYTGTVDAPTPGQLPNELASVTYQDRSTTTFGYDPSGATSTITQSTGTAYTLLYDALGRLHAVVRSDTSSTPVGVYLHYNTRGLRDAYTVETAGENGAAPQIRFQEVLSYRGNQVGQVVVTGTATTPFTETFVYRPDGAPLELLYQRQDGQGTATLARYWYVLDGQGSVIGLANQSGTLVDMYAYDVWGAPTPGGITEAVPQPLRYRGYWWDGWDDSLGTSTDQGWDTGPLPWYWLGTRSYDPTLKRFLQPDPSAQDGVRSYAYCHDDPVDCTDPSGLAGEPGEWVQLPIEWPTGEGGVRLAGPIGEAGVTVGDASGEAGLPDTTWGPAIPSGDTIDAVSAELGSEPIATLTFEDGWQKTVPETDPSDKFIYVVFDSDTGVIMKPGQTAGSRYRLINRFGYYARAARKLWLTARLRLALWETPAESGRALDAVEDRVRDLLEGMGHGLPWENDRLQRLGRPGSGTPFVGDDGRGTWTDDPQSPNHGQFRSRGSGAYYPQDPPYYPPWTPDQAE